ncbi:MAG: IS3 family transposase [Dermatophilaceae bacterium]
MLNRKQWNTHVELANTIFDYLETFDNPRRNYPALGMLTPIEFEPHHLSPSLDSKTAPRR